ncbi:MAG: hypothetical protein ACSHX3_16845, partial [Litorimonas sp.]
EKPRRLRAESSLNEHLGRHRSVTGPNYAKREAAQEAMQGMARGLERDPQLESLLANRKRDLGITFDTGHRSLGRDLAINHGLDHVRSRGLSR